MVGLDTNVTTVDGNVVAEVCGTSGSTGLASRDQGAAWGPEAAATFNTTCVVQPRPTRTINHHTPLPQSMLHPLTAAKSCSEKQIVQIIILSIWLLRSKIHRKEFRRKARWNS